MIISDLPEADSVEVIRVDLLRTGDVMVHVIAPNLESKDERVVAFASIVGDLIRSSATILPCTPEELMLAVILHLKSQDAEPGSYSIHDVSEPKGGKPS